MQLVAVDTPCILLVSYSSAVFCFSYGYGSLYNPSPLLRVPDRCNTFSDKIFHIPTYPRTLPSGRCRYILTPVYLQGFCRFYFQAWNITIIIFIKIIKANQTACLKIRLCGYNLRHSHNSMRIDKKEKLTGYVWCGVSWGWGEKWAGRGRGRKAIFKHTLGKNRLRNQTVCHWATPKERQ